MQKAIQENKRITFTYASGIGNSEICEKISPFLLALSDGAFFLIAGDRRAENGLACFELDKITNLTVLPDKRDNIVTYTGDIDFSLQRYAEGLFAKDRNVTTVIARIKRSILKEFTEKYSDLHIHKKDGEFFTVEFTACISSDFILSILLAGKNVQILSPESTAEIIANILHDKIS